MNTILNARWNSTPLAGHATIRSVGVRDGSWDDRLEFSNGCVVEDLPGEKGVLLTDSNGNERVIHGWVDRFGEEERPAVYFSQYDQLCDEDILWEQAFPAEGGTVLTKLSDVERDSSRTVHIGPNGQITVLAKDPWEYPEELHGKVQDGKVVLQGVGGSETIDAPVAPEWFIR